MLYLLKNYLLQFYLLDLYDLHKQNRVENKLYQVHFYKYNAICLNILILSLCLVKGPQAL